MSTTSVWPSSAAHGDELQTLLISVDILPRLLTLTPQFWLRRRRTLAASRSPIEKDGECPRRLTNGGSTRFQCRYVSIDSPTISRSWPGVKSKGVAPLSHGVNPRWTYYREFVGGQEKVPLLFRKCSATHGDLCRYRFFSDVTRWTNSRRLPMPPAAVTLSLTVTLSVGRFHGAIHAQADRVRQSR